MNPDATWPSAPGGETLSPPLSTRDLRAFAGGKAFVRPFSEPVDYYVPRWVSALKNGPSHAGFNWAAALCGSNWCFWRKLYGLAFAILIAEFISSLLVVMILVQGLGWEPQAESLGSAAWLALVPVRALLGKHANTLYLSRAIETVAAARQTRADPEAQQTFLAGRGGTSWLVLGIALGVQLTAMFAPAFGSV